MVTLQAQLVEKLAEAEAAAAKRNDEGLRDTLASFLAEARVPVAPGNGAGFLRLATLSHFERCGFLAKPLQLPPTTTGLLRPRVKRRWRRYAATSAPTRGWSTR